VDSEGWWIFSLPVDDCGDYTLVLEAVAPDGKRAYAQQPACASQPAPTLVLEALMEIFLPLIVR